MFLKIFRIEINVLEYLVDLNTGHLSFNFDELQKFPFTGNMNMRVLKISTVCFPGKISKYF